jgi:Protein of unknown function (DUF2958)
MQLLTAELRAQLPPLYSQETKEDPPVICKYFTPDSNWTWFVTEGSPDEDNPKDIRFFGFVIGQASEWGYFMLSELESSRGPSGLPIERDLHFQPGPFSEVIRRHRQTHGG